MPKIQVKNVFKVFGDSPEKALRLWREGMNKKDIVKKTKQTIGVADASFEVNEGEIFVVMGLSGSGKSTLLRCLNRLIEPSSGQILLNGKDVVTASDDELRQVRLHEMAMVFQHFGLLPHRTVISNVAFGLEIQGIPREERFAKAQELIKTVGLEGYENMMTGELSGGMQQRVGLARALTTDPEILLMDEAFSALDPLIRNNMQDELLDIQDKLHKTIIFITHDLDEALKLGDRIAIMKDGIIVQIGTPEEILTDPANAYVEAFVENVSRGKIITASSIMFEKPTLIRLKKNGPKETLRRMRQIGTNVLPVIDDNHVFCGFVTDEDMAELSRENITSIQSKLITDIPIVKPDVPVEEILPLYLGHNFPLPVVDDDLIFKGIVTHPSVIGEIIGKNSDEVQEIREAGETL